MEKIVCFIDDSKFEHDLVTNEIAPAAPDLVFVQTYTFDEARERLGRRIPALFLLDLWGKDEDVLEPCVTSREELEERILGFPTLGQVYEGLEEFAGDEVNEYLKRLFSIVECWRSLFEVTCQRAGQNRKYGLANLKQVRSFYPGVPAVFYTRKSLISDAVALYQAGADGLFIKPTGLTDTETRRLTREYAPNLLDALGKFMNSAPCD